MRATKTPGRRAARATSLLLLPLLLALVAGCGRGSRAVAVERAGSGAGGPTSPSDAQDRPRRARATTTTAAAAPPSTTGTTTPAPPVPTTLPAPTTAPVAVAAGPPSPWTAAVYRGMGAWVDVYDWTDTWSHGKPSVTLASIDRMAQLGVRTLYLQSSRPKSMVDVEEPERFRALVERAHTRGLTVVAWYLPTFVDPALDLRRLLAAAALPVDGLSVNIESTEVADVDERNRRVIALSRDLRARVGPAKVLGTVVLNPFALDELATKVWPRFPWDELDAFYEVWQPMVYVSYRKQDDPYRNAERYTDASIARMRDKVGDEPVHPVTGVADAMTVADVEGFARATIRGGAVGGGIYDWATSSEAMWAALHGVNR